MITIPNYVQSIIFGFILSSFQFYLMSSDSILIKLLGMIFTLFLAFGLYTFFLWYSCYQNNSNIELNSSSTLFSVIAIIVVIFGLVKILSPLFARTPILYVFSFLVNGLLGFLVLAALFGVSLYGIIEKGNYCK